MNNPQIRRKQCGKKAWSQANQTGMPMEFSNKLRDKYAKTVAEWSSALREGGEIEVDVTQVATGQMTITGTKTTRLTLSEENIETAF